MMTADELRGWFEANREAVRIPLAMWQVDGHPPETVDELMRAMRDHDRWHLEPANQLAFLSEEVRARWVALWTWRAAALDEILGAA